MMKFCRVCLLLLIVGMLCCPLNIFAEESSISDSNVSSELLKYDGELYSIDIFDEAKILDENEINAIVDVMRQVSVYANVSFVSYPAGGSNLNSATKAMNWGNNQFGSDVPFVVFIIDMTTRHLDIYASKPLVKTLNATVLNSIADNVYRYASRGEYGECVVETFRLVVNVLKDEEWLSEEFIFREKIRWGMSEKEVAEVEGEGIRIENGFSASLIAKAYMGIPVSKFQGYLIYVFSSDHLVVSMYVLNGDENIFNYMEEALEAVYGEKSETSVQEYVVIMSALTSGSVTETDLESVPLSKWMAPGDTDVFLSLVNSNLSIMYVSPEFLSLTSDELKEIITTGL